MELIITILVNIVWLILLFIFCYPTYQWFNDLHPQARAQLDYLLLWPNQRIDKLEIIHKEADLALPFDTFLEVYRDATSAKYNFLMVDIRNEKYRKNFNLEYILN